MPDEWAPLRHSVERAARNLRQLASDVNAFGARTGREYSPLPTAGHGESDTALLEHLLAILDTFPTLVGYLNGRRTSGSIVAVTSEADVQDLLYLTLKPSFPDLVYEEPTKKGAAGYSIGDFSIPCLKLILEAKYIANAADVKGKADEMAEDIWKYTTQTDCQHIIFFVYDPQPLIPDRTNYTRALSTKAGEFSASGRVVEIRTIIKP